MRFFEKRQSDWLNKHTGPLAKFGNPILQVSSDQFKKLQKKLLAKLKPVSHARAYGRVSEEMLVFEIENISLLPIELQEVNDGQTVISKAALAQYVKKSVYPSTNKLILPPPSVSKQILKLSIPVSKFADVDEESQFKVVTRIIETPHKQSTRVLNYSEPFLKNAHTMEGMPKKSTLVNYSALPFLRRGSSPLEWSFRPGRHRVRKTIRFPIGTQLRIQAGTTLSFDEGAGIILPGQLLALGTPTKPIQLKPSAKSWAGLFVYEDKRVSELRYVNFHGAAGYSQGSWKPTGAVTFLKTQVKISRCSFNNFTSEDMVNLVRSEILVLHSSFDGTVSDAIDCDFSNGMIQHSNFQNIKGDGIDVSGSKISAYKIEAKKIGDKAFSAGEGSSLDVEQTTIDDTFIAFASKDLSKLHVKSAQLNNIKIGLLAFQKKPEYGGAQLKASQLHFTNVKRPHLVQEGSAALLDGTKLGTQAIDVEALYAKILP